MERPPLSSPRNPPNRQQIGAEGELAARRHLEQRGCQLVCSNYRSYRGEIDLVMLQEQCLLFIEVRLRRHTAFGGAFGSITFAKQQKIIASARAFLHHHPQFQGRDCRFDVVALQHDHGLWQIEWLPAAFTT